MKITEYARVQGAWHPVREYYWFTPEPDTVDPENLRPPRRPCEGCGQLISRAFIRAHECLGGTAEYPRLPRARVKTVTSQDPAGLRAYMQSRRHPTVTSGE